jgi:hypothetical protein
MAIIAIVVALGLIGVVAVTIVSIQQQAVAVSIITRGGCKSGSTGDSASGGHCFHSITNGTSGQ